MTAVVIILPLIRIERCDSIDDVGRRRRADRVPPGVDLSNQALNPSSDRRNVVDLARARDAREQAEPHPQPPRNSQGD